MARLLDTPCRRIHWTLALITAALLCARTSAAEPVRVELKSGRAYTAEVDAQTNDKQLWLRFGQPGAFLFRPIAWQQILRAEYNGKALTDRELRALAPEIATKGTPRPPVEPAASGPLTGKADSAFDTSPDVGRLTSVQFDAYLANWDADVEADGLIVRLYPLADDGQIAPVGGTLDVDLVTVRRRDFNQIPDGQGRSFESIARWNVSVSPADLGPSGTVLRLPFQAIHPEFDTTVAPYGLVHLRYAAAGYGVYESSQDVVRIRPFVPLRDALQQSGHDRFLPLEQRGR